MAIDTAGVKPQGEDQGRPRPLFDPRAERSIRRADVTLLFLDPTQTISRLDKQLADYIAKQYKPCIFVVNKWDLLVLDPEQTQTMGKYAQGVQHAFRSMAYMPLAFITAKTGKNVKAAAQLVAVDVQAGESAGRHVQAQPDVREAVERIRLHRRRRAIPASITRRRSAWAPPTVVLFVNSPSLFDSTYQRYLLNVFREKLPYHDIPIKLYLQARTQTDPSGKEPYDQDGRQGPQAEGAGSRFGIGLVRV